MRTRHYVVCCWLLVCLFGCWLFVVCCLLFGLRCSLCVVFCLVAGCLLFAVCSSVFVVRCLLFVVCCVPPIPPTTPHPIAHCRRQSPKIPLYLFHCFSLRQATRAVPTSPIMPSDDGRVKLTTAEFNQQQIMPSEDGRMHIKCDASKQLLATAEIKLQPMENIPYAHRVCVCV